MRKIATFVVGSVAALGLAAGPAAAAVTFDEGTGTGFVGKGDVQLALNLNNAQVQQQASTIAGEFTYAATTVTEVSWICTNTKNENLQERERTTTTETSGVVAGVTRDSKKQVTGFNLTGYSGTPTESSATDGPAVNSCPTNWVLTTPAGDPVEISSTGGLFVRGVPLQ